MKIENGEAATVGADGGPIDPALSVERTQSQSISRADQEQVKRLADQQCSSVVPELDNQFWPCWPPADRLASARAPQRSRPRS